MKLTDVQARWQSAALWALLKKSGDYGPWVAADEVTGAIRDNTGCTYQAANGALKALLTAGLVDYSETSEGNFWKATDAADRAYDLLLAPFKGELAAIEERLEGIDHGLDTILWLQETRAKLAPPNPDKGGTDG